LDTYDAFAAAPWTRKHRVDDATLSSMRLLGGHRCITLHRCRVYGQSAASLNNSDWMHVRRMQLKLRDAQEPATR